MRRVFLEVFLYQRVSAYRFHESLNLGYSNYALIGIRYKFAKNYTSLNMKRTLRLTLLLSIAIICSNSIQAQNSKELKKAQKSFEKKLKGRGHHLDYIYHLLLNDLEHNKDLAENLHNFNDTTHAFKFSKRESSLLFTESFTIEIERGITLNIFLAKFNNDILDEHYTLAICVYEVERKRLDKMALAGYWNANETLERLSIANEYHFKDYLRRRFEIKLAEIKFLLEKDLIILDDTNINKHALSSEEQDELLKNWSWLDKKIHRSVKFFESISIYTLGKGHTKISINDERFIEVTPENIFVVK